MNRLHETIFNEKRMGYAYYKIQLDEKNETKDFHLVESNEIFDSIIKVKQTSSKKTNLCINDLFDEMNDTLKSNKSRTYCRPLLDDIYKIDITSPEAGYLLVIISNISGIEKMLYDNEKSYKKIVNNLSDIIWIIDFDFNVTYINEAMQIKIDALNNEVIGQKITKFIIDDKLKNTLKEYKRKSKEIKDDFALTNMLEIEHTNNDGTTYIYEYMLSFLKNEKGKKEGIIGVGRDVTEEKLTKRNLIDSEEKLRLIMTSTVEGIFGIDLNGICTFSNDSAIRLLGFDRKSEVLGENLCKLTNQFNDNPNVCIFNDIIKKKPSIYKFEHIFKKKNGDLFNAECNSFPQYNNGVLTGFLITFYDITGRIMVESELRESVRRNSILLSNLPGMAFRRKHNDLMTIQFVSKGCYDLTEYYEDSLISNKDLSYSEIIDPLYKDALVRAWQHAIDNKTRFDGEYQIITASGTLKWVLERGQVLYDSKGNVEALEGLVIDITELKQTQEAITYLSYHDALTGLFNRLFYEMEKGMADIDENLPISIIMGDINGLKLINDSFGHDQGDKLIVETAKAMDNCCRENDTLARIGGDEFAILLPKTTNEEGNNIIDRINTKSKEYNSINHKDSVLINISLGCATKTIKTEKLSEIQKEAEDYMYKCKLLERSSSHSAIVDSIKTALFEKNHETEEHANRLREYSLNVGKRLNLSKNELDDLALFATLHDIGKVSISSEILNKPSSLNEKEWEEIKKHPEAGYRIAKASAELISIADYIMSHHERWDGKGYPQKIKEEKIPLLSRILSVVDAYDAMTTDKPYRIAMTKEEALEEIRLNSGTQFDPSIVKVFLELFSNEKE